MLAAGFERELHQGRVPPEALDDAIVRPGGQRRGVVLGYGTAAAAMFARDRPIDRALGRLWHPAARERGRSDRSGAP